ncbi:MAG: electron transfer flavoprotein subunit alpha/FixB family protein [Chloroflexota bacterium]
MAGIWAVAELVDGRPTRLTLELATMAASLAAEASTDAVVILVGADTAATAEIAAHGPAVLSVAPSRTGAPSASSVAVTVAALIEERAPDVVLVGATPDGREIAGSLLGLTDLPVLVAGSAVGISDGTLRVQMPTFGGRLITSSGFPDGRGIVIVRPGALTAQKASRSGRVEQVSIVPNRTLAEVSVIERVDEASAGPSIDDARTIVGAGRGVGGPEGLALIAELAEVLGGAVGATRAAVDSGWIDFGQQIGQTGKTVKPDLYVACGVSGAIQHKVGVQSAGTIVAINKDPDAPIVEFADLVVVGDLFEIVPRLSAAIRAAAIE